MIAMPIAGRLTDKTGVGRIVPVGLVVVGLSVPRASRSSRATRPTGCSAPSLFVMGLGMGFTMMPTFSGAMQTLRRAAIARASTTLNINQQVGASIGTAVLSVMLTAEIDQPSCGGGGGGGIGRTLPPAVRERVAPELADAFGATFWYALALIVVAFVVAIVLLPKQKPEPVDDPDVPEAAEAAPVLVAH